MSSFLENVSTHYLWYILFVWRLLMWKKKFSKEVQMLFPLLAKRWNPWPLRVWQTLSNISTWRAHRPSEVKGGFAMAPTTVVLSMFILSLHELQAACNPVTEAFSLNVSKYALYPKWSQISERLPWLLLILGYEQNTEAGKYQKKKKCLVLLFIMYLYVCAPALFELWQVSK